MDELYLFVAVILGLGAVMVVVFDVHYVAAAITFLVTSGVLFAYIAKQVRAAKDAELRTSGPIKRICIGLCE
jgi:hypothetical protein